MKVHIEVEALMLTVDEARWLHEKVVEVVGQLAIMEPSVHSRAELTVEYNWDGMSL